uniref:Fibrillin-3 n=1 Tax=Magallana gigas TaxID=29159 RepID=K1PWV2_MAGGI
MAITCELAFNVDECSKGERNFCDKLASCTNTVGSYSCTCPKGYYGSGFYCHDKDECRRRSDNKCHSRAKCTNTPGSYTCSCLSGYTGDGVKSCSRKR